MALILAFRATEATPPGEPVTPHAAAPATSPSRSAELIFFPGVRYERHALGHEPGPAVNARRCHRIKPRELIDLMD